MTIIKVSSHLLKTYPRTEPTSHSTTGSRITRLLFALLLILSSLFPVIVCTTHAAQVTLAWDANTEPNVSGYRVYYGTTSRNYEWFVDVGNVTNKTLTDADHLSDGSTYYFAATAYDDSQPALESAYSDEVSKNTCSYAIDPTVIPNFNASGGTVSVSVTTQSGCTWTASSATWMSITSGGSGTGNGTVSYSVAANTSPSPRTAGLTVAKHTFTLTQAGAAAYTITASSGTGGTISPSGSVSVAQGASQSFTISANTGYQIASVTVDGVSQGAVSSYTFSNVTATHTIGVSFMANATYSITASTQSGGSISPSGTLVLPKGNSANFTITPNTGYRISKVVVDGRSVGAVSSYTFSNVAANHKITAQYRRASR